MDRAIIILLLLCLLAVLSRVSAQNIANPGLLGPICGPNFTASALCQPPPRCSTLNGTNPACSGLFPAIGWP